MDKEMEFGTDAGYFARFSGGNSRAASISDILVHHEDMAVFLAVASQAMIHLEAFFSGSRIIKDRSQNRVGKLVNDVVDNIQNVVRLRREIENHLH